MKLGAVINTVTKYWKYIWLPWTQPVPTSDGVMGGATFACGCSGYIADGYAYNAFSGGLWHSAKVYPSWLSWYNPVPIKINRIMIDVGNSSSYPDLPKNYSIQASDDGTNWITLYDGVNTDTSFPATIDVDLSNISNNYHKYWRYYVSSGYNRTYANARNVRLYAEERSVIEGTEEDYDFTSQEYKSNLPILNNQFQAPII